MVTDAEILKKIRRVLASYLPHPERFTRPNEAAMLHWQLVHLVDGLELPRPELFFANEREANANPHPNP